MALAPAHIDELLERERSQWSSRTGPPTYAFAASFARAIESAACAKRDARIAELERQLEDARKDAERYRWLRSDDIEVLPGEREIYVVMARLPFTDSPDETLTEAALDAAIDNAMQKGQQ